MPDQDLFLRTYLAEIGVHTPVSIVHAETPPANVVDCQAPAQGAESDSLPPIHGLDDLSAKARGCRLCALAETRNKVVFGIGNPAADLVFIGEAPGRDEDLQGEPFVGRAGQLLDRMLAGIRLSREQVYIMNTIKCRPPNNRDPRQEEVDACHLWFEQQLDILAPKIICLLGRVAAQTVLQTDAPLGSLLGRWHEYQGIPAWVTYHPAYLLRSPSQKQRSWQDLLVIAGKYHELQ